MGYYKFKSGSHIKANPQAVGEQFEMLAQTEEGLTPETVLKANTPEGTPLHDCYEWDDTKAAHQYRLNQSGHFIRCVEIRSEKTEDNPNPVAVRAFFTVSEHKYEPLHAIIQNENKQATLLKQAFSELDAFQKKYNTLQALSPVFDAIVTAKVGATI